MFQAEKAAKLGQKMKEFALKFFPDDVELQNIEFDKIPEEELKQFVEALEARGSEIVKDVSF